MNRHAMTPIDRRRAFLRPRRGRAHPLRRWLALGALLALLWAAGVAWFGFTMPQTPADGGAKTDAIFVLTGGAGRLAEGIRLLKEGAAPILFVSGVDPRVDKRSVLRSAGGAPAELHARIVLGFRARHTRGNAAETARWVRAENLTSLRLVTANYHMRRSLLELRHALPDTSLVAHPVVPATVSREGWWRSRRGIAVVTAEFYKYAAALMRIALTSAAAEGPEP